MKRPTGLLLKVHSKGFLQHEIYVQSRRMKSPRAPGVNVKQMAGKAGLLSSLWPPPLLFRTSIFEGERVEKGRQGVWPQTEE